MSVETDLAALKATIEGLPTRDNIFSLLDILSEVEQPEKDIAIESFLEDYPTASKSIMADLLSYSNYVSITEET